MKNIMLALAIATLTSSAYSADEGLWKNLGAAPYASSKEEAYRNSSIAINGFVEMPLAVKAHFDSVVAVADTCKCRVTGTWLVPGMPFEEMWSGGKPPYVMLKRTMDELPVFRSPDGRLYRKDAKVSQTAWARTWSFVYEGKTYVLYLPYVCFNWAWAFGLPPVAPIEQCVTASFKVKPGDEVRFAILAQKRLPASACWQLCDGINCSMFPSPCDICDWFGPKSVIPFGFEPLHTGRYIAYAENQTLRLPMEAIYSYIVICIEREGLGQSDSWIIQPSAWIGVTTIVVPYGGQEWPSWGKVDLSKWK